MTDGESKPNEESGQELEQPLNSEYRVEELQDDVIEDLFVPAFEQLDRLLANLQMINRISTGLCVINTPKSQRRIGLTRIQGSYLNYQDIDVKSSGRGAIWYRYAGYR
jgi:hypothetical protein